MELAECSETSLHKIQMSGNHPNQDYILFNSQLISVAQLRAVLGQLYATFKSPKACQLLWKEVQIFARSYGLLAVSCLIKYV